MAGDIDSNPKIVAIAREENKKVYAKIYYYEPNIDRGYDSDEEEFAMYDFSIESGDCLDVAGWISGEECQGITYVKINGSWRKYFNFTRGGNDVLGVVEGMGGRIESKGEVTPLLLPFAYQRSCLDCVHMSMEYVKDLASGEFEWYTDGFGSVEDAKAETAGLSVMQGDGWLRVGVDCDCYRRAELTDAKGAIVDAVELSGGSEAELSTAGLSPGVYVVSLISDTTVRSVKVLVK